MIERFIFRASRGHSCVMFVPRECDPKSLVMLTFLSVNSNSFI